MRRPARKRARSTFQIISKFQTEVESRLYRELDALWRYVK